MKKIIITILAVSALFTGCKKEKIGNSEGAGYLSLELSGDKVSYTDDIVAKSEANTETVNVNDFSIVIEGLNGAYRQSWEKYSEVPSVLELSSGEYTITATSPKTTEEQWGEPVFSGSKNFKIDVGATSTVEVACSITNVKVSIVLAEAFVKEIPEYEITVMEDVESGKALTWKKDDVTAGYAGYFSAVPLLVKVKGYRWDNGTDTPSVASYSTQIKDVSPANHYILNLSANTTGNGSIQLTLDPNLNDQNENIDIPGLIETPVDGGDDTPPSEDEPEEPSVPAISIEWPENPTFERTEIVEGMNVNLTINVPAGIKTFVVSVDSPALNSILPTMTSDGSTNLDLIGDAKVKATLSTMLPTGDQLLNQTSVDFSLSGLLPLILGFQTSGDHKFTLAISDNAGNQMSQTLVFYTK